MTTTGLGRCDPNSWSNPDEVSIHHFHLKLDIDFDKQIVDGFTEIEVSKKNVNAVNVDLDCKQLDISKITLHPTNTDLSYTLGESIKGFGAKLSVRIPENIGNERFKICIKYKTSKTASALQWLSPRQTAGKKFPYLFSQCQAIHARSLLPCQDTPAVKFTYSAEVKVPKELMALMSALRKGSVLTDDDSIIYKFSQPIVIPSYLIAIAVGKLESRQIGPRTCVWSEKELINKAAAEFLQTEEFLQVAEHFCGPYVWGVYDLLVLPPSFPFGGMENPCLTFVTPTLLAGDRSLADVVAHEISHSWTGNLVTNSTFEHFWLNEGFTVFIERKILGHLSGQPARHFHALNGMNELKYTIDRMGTDNPFTKLVLDLKGVDPDDAFSTVPYEKGHTLLFHLECLVGGPDAFEPFLRAYIENYKFKSISTENFKTFFKQFFKSKEFVHSFDWDLWLDNPGMPPVIPHYDDTLSSVCKILAERWIEWDPSTGLGDFSADEFLGLNGKQIEAFLNCLLQAPPLPIIKLKQMQDLYNLNGFENSEIYFRWLRLCIKGRWLDQVKASLEFVSQQGRMKFVRPIYRDLYNWERVREEAIENFKTYRLEMMYVTAYTLAKDLHLSD